MIAFTATIDRLTIVEISEIVKNLLDQSYKFPQPYRRVTTSDMSSSRSEKDKFTAVLRALRLVILNRVRFLK